MRAYTVAVVLLLVACSKPASTSAPTPEPAPVDTTIAGPAHEDRATFTAAACEEQGGTVIGDIGDGAIHRPDYRCESGERPIGSIVAETGGPIAVEGSVCCK